MKCQIQLPLLWILLVVFCATPWAALGAELDDRTKPILLNDVPPDGSAVLTWAYFTEDERVRPQDVWKVEDGVIICQGTPRGYIRTDQEYTNFTLRLEWRWPKNKKPGRGGVLIRTTGEDKIWPKCLEAQINSPDAGDFWGLIGYNLSGPADRYKQVDHEQLGKLTNLKKIKDAEKPHGEWNLYEIIADRDVVTLKINGQEVNRATGCDVVAGKICITSEGDEIHFRNIRLIPNGKKTEK